MRARHACVASTGEIFRAAIARERVSSVQSVTALVEIALALERGREASGLLGNGEVGRRPLDGGGEARDLRAGSALWLAHVGDLPAHDSTG